MPPGDPQPGEAYWLDDVPPLDGEIDRRGVVVVVVPPVNGIAIVLGATCTPGADDTAILVERGLPRSCWVLPRWDLNVRSDRLTEPAGRVGGLLLMQILSDFEDESYAPRDRGKWD